MALKLLPAVNERFLTPFVALLWPAGGFGEHCVFIAGGFAAPKAPPGTIAVLQELPNGRKVSTTIEIPRDRSGRQTGPPVQHYPDGTTVEIPPPKTQTVRRSTEKVTGQTTKSASGSGNAPKGGLRVFNRDEATQHFGVHGSELAEAFSRKFYNLADYLDDANHVINNGTFVPELNGYVRLIGGRGSAKYAFVGLERGTDAITTFHIKTVKELIKKAPSLGLSR